MDGLRVSVYGGAAGDRESGEIGGNRILVEWDDGAWFFDFGTRFKASGRFYEEFVKPRSSVGLRDFLSTGLLPPLEGLYRDDLYCHEPDCFDGYRDRPDYRRIERVDGVLVSHAHLDHNGSVGFLREDVPVYTGLASAVTAKAMQDSRSSAIDFEPVYHAPRQATDDGMLEGVRGARHQRRYVVCEDVDPSTELRAMWCKLPGPRTTLEACPLEVGCPDGMRFWRVDHSIPGSGAFALETSAGWVVYSGDVRRHGHSAWRLDDFVAEAAALDPALLIVEGTRVGETDTTSEEDVRSAAGDVVARTDGLVIADFGPRNIERLRTFHEIASATDRRLVITKEDAYLLAALHMVDENIPDPAWGSVAVLRERQGSVPVWARDVYDRYAADVVDAADIRADPAGHILCISYWDIQNLVDIEPRGGTYIYSSAEAFTEEMRIDQQRLGNWLTHFGLDIVGGLPGAEEGPFHASGHADGPTMEELIEELGADKILPVHTEDLGWFRERWAEKLS